MADQSPTKSVITCDLEGRIETFNKGAEQIFGYSADEVIGKKRVSLFSPGFTVLEHVPQWLATAKQKGEFESETVFLRKDGSPIAARVRITPTFRGGVQIGYCGVTEQLTEADLKQAAPQISWLTRVFAWLVITRAPFLTAIIVPVLIGAAWVAAQGLVEPFPWARFGLVLLAGITMHVAANTFNDYFDWRSGTDRQNNAYFLPYTGGSRSIELGLISESALFRVALGSLLISMLVGLYLASSGAPAVLIFGLFGAFSSYFYTAPPLRLVARRGLGELAIGLNFGPLAVAGTIYAMTGHTAVVDYLLGIPIGLLTTAILWINQFPDEEADRATGKINLVVALGKQRARWGYPLLMLAAFGLVLYWGLSNTLPVGALLILGGLPLAVYASRVILNEYARRSLARANAATIQLHLVSGLLMAAGLLLSSSFTRWLGL